MDDIPKFTRRELKVLTLVAQGMNSKEIARHFNLSPRTIDFYRLRVETKLGARNPAHAAAIAVRDCIIDLDAVVPTEELRARKPGPRYHRPVVPAVGAWLQRGGRLS